jgi:hypothetical protein
MLYLLAGKADGPSSWFSDLKFVSMEMLALSSLGVLVRV